MDGTTTHTQPVQAGASSVTLQSWDISPVPLQHQAIDPFQVKPESSDVKTEPIAASYSQPFQALQTATQAFDSNPQSFPVKDPYLDDEMVWKMNVSHIAGTSSSSGCKCVVRGSVNIDDYFFVDEIARPGETKSSKHYLSRLGGKGANQAVAIARAGGQVQLYATIGSDGLAVKQGLQGHGIDVSGVLVSELSTGRAMIQVSDSGQNSIVLYPGANFSEIHEEMRMAKGEALLLEGTTHLLVQNEINLRSTLRAIEEARSKGVVTIYNPSPIPPVQELLAFPWDKIDWLVMNEIETESLLRILGPPAGIIEPNALHTLSRMDKMRRLSKHPSFANTNLICTLGRLGAVAYAPAIHKSLQPHFADSAMIIDPVRPQGSFRDSTGAGDCFMGYFVAGLMEFGPGARVGHEIKGPELMAILKKANLAAAMSVERPGTIDAVPFRADVDARMQT